MKKTFSICLILILIFLLSCRKDKAEESFPDKPIKIIVYTGPGGLIDVTSRKFTEIAAKYSDANFVVENKPGAGGIVALKKVLQTPSDGYTLFACTKSNISKFVSTGGNAYIEALDWIAMLMADPECIITNKKADLNSWAEIVEDAKQKDGKQIWVGPATGGLDHITAMKIWEKSNIRAKWVPYKSGGKARAALLGKLGVAYVGNPREVIGNPDLKIAAVSSNKRLPQFPDAPTLTELGIPELENEFMWRGFAIKKGVHSDVIAWYKDLFRKVTDDPQWQTFWEKGGISVVYYDSDKFTQIVKEDEEMFGHYLQKIDIIKTSDDNSIAKLGKGKGLAVLVLSLLIIMIFLGYLVYHSSKRELMGKILIIAFFFSLSIVFYVLSFVFPGTGEVGPNVVPRLWIFILIPLNFILLIKTLKEKKIKTEHGNIILVLMFACLLVLYLVSIYYLGYFISSFLFLSIAMYILGYRKILSMTLISVIWVLFSYLFFYKILYVPLPIGKVIETIFYR